MDETELQALNIIGLLWLFVGVGTQAALSIVRTNRAKKNAMPVGGGAESDAGWLGTMEAIVYGFQIVGAAACVVAAVLVFFL